MAKIISIVNQKGGVGKTTTAFNLSAGLAQLEKRVLLIDFDPQGNLSSYLGFEKDDKPTLCELINLAIQKGTIRPYNSVPDTKEDEAETEETRRIIKSAVRGNETEKLDYIPSVILLSGAEQALINAMCRERVLSVILSYLEGDYDYIIIDCPPSLGILSINALTASDEILVPVQAENFALDGLIQLLDTYKRIRASSNPKLKINGFLLTMTTQTNMSKEVSKVLVEQFGSLVYTSTTVSRSTKAAESTVEQKSLLSGKSKLGEQYKLAALEFIERGKVNGG